MVKNKRLSIFVIFLVIVMCLSLTNVQSAFADDNIPPTSAPVLATEEPVTDVPVIATEETPTEEPVVSTDVPTQAPVVETTPLPLEIGAQPVDEATISDVLVVAPADTEVIVLDENGNPVNLASQEAANILEEADPIWCPASVLIPTAGANGCTTNQTITGLLALMRANAGNAFSQDGKIFLEKPNGAGFTTSLIFDNSVGSLGTSFNTLKNFNIFVIGGWNGGATTTLSGNTNFGNNAVVRFGSSGAGNSWVGNITLQDINVNNNQSANTSVQVFGSTGSVTLNDVNVSNGQGNTALNITTSSGNVSLDNVDVSNQDTGNTGLITSNSGNITISNNSSFNGNGNNLGFSATTTSGTISISDTTFSDAQGNGTGTNRNGATLSAPTVNLTNVDTQNNDLNGIAISNANTITLNNVTADGNGTNPTGPNNSLGSGVLVNGTGTTVVTVTGGDFTNNERYGLEILNATVNVISQPTFSGNGMGNSNVISDSTPPTVTPTVTCATPGNNGWCRSNIQVTWTIADSESFITNTNNCGTTNVTNNTSSAGTTVTCTATTSGGTTSNSVTVYRDANAPFNVNGAPNRIPDSNGWYNHAVNIVFTGTDNNSGIASCSNIVYSGPNGTNRSVTGTCTDLAGNVSAAVNSSNFNYDGALPTITAAITGGTLGTNGWYRSNVTVHFTCTDTGGSNINFGACPADQTLSAEGSSISSTAQTVTDRAGNVSAPSNIITVSIDKTRPTILAAATTSPNAAGWYNSNVTVQFTCTDGGSGIATCPANQTLSATGSSTTQTATDVAGNTSLASNTVAVKIDKTIPTISAAIISGTLGSNGWYTSNVTIHFTCADTGGSGLPVGACPADEVLSTEGSSVTSSAQTVTDTAGNASAPSNTFTVKIDKTAPSAIANLSSVPNVNGWHNNNVVVSFSGVDGSGSGIASCSASVNLSEGAGQSASGTCTDNAGNVSAPATASGINIDKTAPSASASASPLPNANGWNNTNVTVTFTGSDALSGIDVCDADVVLSTEGAGQSASGTCTDKAGNVSNTANVTNINIDKTNPTITVPANITREATSASGATVTYSASASDTLDNNVTVSCTPSSGSTFAIGSTLVTCSSTDQAGNMGSNSFTITVQDTTAPSVTVPANITAEATAASGATVNFSLVQQIQ
ncbi:MAG: HYR domain-containing protein [Anaerolineales bacterium]